MKTDLCADEIVRTIRALWHILPVPVEPKDVAERVGATEASVRPRMARLAREGQHVRDGALANVRIQHGDALEVLERVVRAALKA